MGDVKNTHLIWRRMWLDLVIIWYSLSTFR